MGIGLFIGMFSLFTVAPWTLIDVPLLFRVFLVMCFAGNLLPYLRSGLWLGMERLEWFLFHFFAVWADWDQGFFCATFFCFCEPGCSLHLPFIHFSDL